MGKSKSVHPPCDGAVIKRCYKCEREQPADCFRPDVRHLDGRVGMCRKCEAAKCLASHNKHKAKRLAEARAWRKENPAQYKTPEARKYFNDRYHRIKHTQKFKDMKNRSARKRRATDPIYRFERTQRDRINQALKYNPKSGKFHELLGCTPRQAVYHITGGGFEIPKGIHIDHYVPIAFFDLSKPEHQRVCFNWRNLQLLTPKANMEKRDHLPRDYRCRLIEICKGTGVSLSVFNLTEINYVEHSV